jgi:hypothetical protein
MPQLHYVWSRNMQLRVAAPTASGWQLAEAGPAADGLLAAFRCMYGQPPDALALNAYARTLSAEHQCTVEQLCERDWLPRWRPSTFSEIASIDVRARERPGKYGRACEVLIDGRAAQSEQTLRVREWHVPQVGRLLIASAAGPPPLHERFAKEIDSWLVHAELGA